MIHKQLLQGFCLSFMLWALSGCSSDEIEASEGKAPGKITLEQWGERVDDMVFQNQIRLGQIQVKFKNESRLVEFSPQKFVIMGRGREACEEWMNWGRLRQEGWIFQLSVKGVGQLRCPSEDLFHLHFERKHPVRPKQLNTTPENTGEGPGKALGEGSGRAPSPSLLSGIRLNDGNVAPFKIEACPDSGVGSIVSSPMTNGEWLEQYRGCSPVSCVPDEGVKEVEDRWVIEERVCEEGFGIQTWGRTETRERQSQCLMAEASDANQGFGRIWGPWVPSSDWVLVDGSCSVDVPICEPLPAITEVRRTPCPSGLVGFIDEIRERQSQCVGQELMMTWSPWLPIVNACVPCVANKKLQMKWVSEGCMTEGQKMRKWVGEVNCRQDDRAEQINWRPTQEVQWLEGCEKAIEKEVGKE